MLEFFFGADPDDFVPESDFAAVSDFGAAASEVVPDAAVSVVESDELDDFAREDPEDDPDDEERLSVL